MVEFFNGKWGLMGFIWMNEILNIMNGCLMFFS